MVFRSKKKFNKNPKKNVLLESKRVKKRVKIWTDQTQMTF